MKQTNWKMRIWMGVLLLVLLLAAGQNFLRAAADSAPQTPQEREVEALRNALQRDGLSEQAQAALEEKLALAEPLAAVQATPDAAALEAKLNAAPPPQSPAQALSLEEQFPEEIFIDSQGLVRPSVITVINGWQGVRGGAALQIFAGSLPDDPQTGLVVILRIDPTALGRQMQLYPAPAGTGALQIEAVQETGVLLRDGNGAAWQLDLPTGEYRAR